MQSRHLDCQRGLAAKLGLIGLLCWGLVACGGGKEEGAAALTAGAPVVKSATKAIPNAAQTQLLFAESAKLNTAELQRAQAQADASAKAAAGSSQSNSKSAQKAAAIASTPAYRFYNNLTGAHFYTINAAERDSVVANLKQFQYEGPAFSVSAGPAAGLSPVHRFYNVQTSVHFYTISDDEKVSIQLNLPQFHYEGIAYYASQASGPGFKPLYRFYLSAKGFHFYTVNEAEKANVINTLPQYAFENVAYYVIDPSYVPPSTLKLPHSGVTDQQCYQVGSDTLVACNTSGATALNAQQDGHRTAINPMAYGLVPKTGGGNYDKTECVKDNITGLIWEGKTASGSGLRAGDLGYTNYDDPTQPQRWNGSAYVNPSQAEIDAASNSVGYKNHVNSIALCGYTNWRLPTADELQGIVDYGVAYPGPTIHTTWFPNTPGDWYRSSSPYVGSADGAWGVYFGGGYVFSDRRNDSGAVRLVRASQ